MIQTGSLTVDLLVSATTATQFVAVQKDKSKIVTIPVSFAAFPSTPHVLLTITGCTTSHYDNTFTDFSLQVTDITPTGFNIHAVAVKGNTANMLKVSWLAITERS